VGKKAKRRFIRRDGSLVEELEPNHRYVVASRRGREEAACEAAFEEARASSIDVLVARLEAETAAGVFYLRNDRHAVRALIEHASEPGVRDRIGALFARGPAEDDLSRRLAGEFGGEARAWLLARIEPYLASPATLGRERAWMSMETAAALLKADPKEHRAARFLVALVEHPDVRSFAVARVVSGYQAPAASAAVAAIFHRAIAPLAHADDATFAGALPALLSLDHAKALARVSSLLDGNVPSHVRSALVRALLSVRSPYRNLPLVLRWLPEGATLRERIEAVAWLAPVLPRPWLSRTIARGLTDESPSLRDMSRVLLVWLPRARARALLECALRDEPDPYLRRLLREELRGR
jgi:hypothetical protein